MREVSIDSTKVRIPIEKVKDISPLITSKWILVNEETGEAITKDRKPYEYSHNGVKVRFSIERQITADQSQRDYLTFVLTSKALGKAYLNGLQKENIEIAYDFIIGSSLAQFTLGDMLEAECTDTDFKRDFQNYYGRDILNKLKSSSKLVKEGRGVTLFNKKDNAGIQFSDRRSDRYMTAPYLKVYSKALDLKSKSKEFAEVNGISVPTDYWRIETTIKNKKHWRKYGVNDTRLSSLLSLSQEKKEEILLSSIKAHLEPQIKERKQIEGITPDEQVWVNILTYLLEKGETYTAILGNILQGIEGSNKTKKRAKIDEIYQKYIKHTEGGQKAEKLEKTFQSMGYDF